MPPNTTPPKRKHPNQMHPNNVAVIRGTLSRDPAVRELPSGDVITQLEVSTPLAEGTTSVPVAVHGTPVTLVAGDEVVVVGHVSRRFFRAGGVTQSRTELVAARVVKASRRRTVEKAVAAAVESLS